MKRNSFTPFPHGPLSPGSVKTTMAVNIGHASNFMCVYNPLMELHYRTFGAVLAIWRVQNFRTGPVQNMLKKGLKWPTEGHTGPGHPQEGLC